jgi:hypothetical protein
VLETEPRSLYKLGRHSTLSYIPIPSFLVFLFFFLVMLGIKLKCFLGKCFTT